MPMFTTNNAAHAMTTMLPTAATEWSYVATGAEQHKPILAQRFRTKLCNKFAECGSCPYLHRCMFAHGEAELRTAGQNVADGLLSEEAIRAFKRYHFEADKLRSYAAAPQHHHHHHHNHNHYPSLPAYASPCADDASSASSNGTRTPPPSMVSSPTASHRVRRHDPYATASTWHPLSPSASPLAAYAKAL